MGEELHRNCRGRASASEELESADNDRHLRQIRNRSARRAASIVSPKRPSPSRPSNRVHPPVQCQSKRRSQRAAESGTRRRLPLRSRNRKLSPDIQGWKLTEEGEHDSGYAFQKLKSKGSSSLCTSAADPAHDFILSALAGPAGEAHWRGGSSAGVH